MGGFVKLFSSIVSSSIWQEEDNVRLVWITMLALSDSEGEVDASIPGLANLARVPIDKCEDAVNTLMSPDPYSRSDSHEGRRIEKIDGGWRILNYMDYRSKSVEVKSRDHRNRYQLGYVHADRGRSPKNRDDEVYMKGYNARASTGKPPRKQQSSTSSKKKKKAPAKKKEESKTFKQWTRDDLVRDVEACNADNLLDAVEMQDFVDYWCEKSASGRLRMHLEKTWDTRRRMQNAVRMIFERQRRERGVAGKGGGQRASHTEDGF